jgi:rusticyanin
MHRNRILTTALTGGLVIGALSTGYVVAQLISYPGPGYAGQYQHTAGGHAGYAASPSQGTSGASPAASSVPMSPAPAGGGDAFTDTPLAQFIARQAGTGLAGKAPQDVPVSQVTALSEQVPANASIDTRADSITFDTTTVSFTVVAIAPGKPDMTFTIAGLTDPAIIVPQGARVTVRFINNDTDEAHGWLITGSQPPFTFGQPATPAITGAFTGIVGDPTAAGDGANTITFAASGTGTYQYICPMPGHAQMGMHGSLTIR